MQELDALVKCLCETVGCKDMGIPKGPPFRLELIHWLALEGEDLDALLPRKLRLDDGAELGVEE